MQRTHLSKQLVLIGLLLAIVMSNAGRVAAHSTDSMVDSFMCIAGQLHTSEGVLSSG